MKTEIEVKFCDIDIDDVRERLKKSGAVCEQPMRLIRREVFHLVTRDGRAFLRIRDEGHKVTMTFKRFEGGGLHAAKEAEVEVSDFSEVASILKETGLKSKSHQETKRETWNLKSVEVVIDERPWIPPFIEIEGPSEKEVREAAAKLGFDWKDSVFGGVAAVYRPQYPAIKDDVTINDLSHYSFAVPAPKEFGERRP